MSWDRGTAKVATAQYPALTYYTKGSYELIRTDVRVYCNDQGKASYNLWGALETTFTSGECSGIATLPDIPRGAVINSFTGTKITEPFTATYTKRSNSYTYKLRVSIPTVKLLERYENYVSGTPVTLSDESIQWIRQNVSGKTVPIGGVIETWNGQNRIAQSEEPTVTCDISNYAKILVNGQWVDAIGYLMTNNEWKELTPYVMVNNEWKEGI